jgi:MFS family permease
MGHSSLWSQALSAPPYLFSFFVVLLTAHKSDKRGARGPFMFFHAILSASFYLLIVLCGLFGLPSWTRYLCLYPACAGFYSCVALVITWQLNNQNSDSKKGASLSILQFFGQCGPLLGTRMFPENDGPLYIKGMAVCSGFMALVAVLTVVLRVHLKKQNLRLLKEGLAKEEATSEAFEDVEAPLVGPEWKSRKGIFLYML